MFQPLIATLASFDVTPDRGFLPHPDSLDRLPPEFAPWEEVARDLPKLLAAGAVRPVLDRLPVLDAGTLSPGQQRQRAMLLLSYFGHAYVWGAAPPADRIPAGIAVPWHRVGCLLGRPPVLSYASYALHNWRRLDPAGPIALGNLALLQNFLGGLDEEWFVLVHVDIEAKAGPALAAAVEAQRAVARSDSGMLRRALEGTAAALEQMLGTLRRMPEGCDPYIYYRRVRPYLHGWKDNPALAGGVVYEGVPEYGGRPQGFRGETGAQSAIIPALDAALGLQHRDDPLRQYLAEMRDYVPPRHRAFIEALEAGPHVRDFVSDRREAPGLREAYNACPRLIAAFRAQHLEYAAGYIQRQARGSAENPTDVGTGGTPFIPYLKKHRQETEEQLIR